MAKYELDLQDYWRLVKKRRWIILLTAAGISGSVYVFTRLQTPVYRAAATVKVEPSMVIQGVSTDQSGFDMYTALNTEVKIIKSAVVAELTAAKLNLFTEYMKDEQKAPIIAAIQAKIDADRVGDTNLITISATSSDPAETAKLANATAEVYIEKGITERNRRARELRVFVEGQLSEAETKLKKTEDDLKNYTEKTGAKGLGGSYAARILELQAKRSEMLKKYTEQHPEIKNIDKQLEETEQAMRQLPAEELEYARLTRDVKINEELYTLLAKRYKEAQISEADRVQSSFIVTPATVPESPIKPNMAINMAAGVALGLIIGFLLALLVENMDTSIGTIEDVEKFIALPVIGIIPHVESDPKYKKLMGKQAGKTDPHTQSLRSKLIVFQPAKSPFVEAYHTLRTNMKFLLSKDKCEVVSFASSGISEGKTITAANFALAAAQSGIKTLLLETDLRRPAVHRMFGLNRDPGFSDCLVGVRTWREVLRGTADFVMSDLSVESILQFPGIENLRIITSGPLPPNPIDLFNSAEIHKILGEMKKEFELIVLDCPPVLFFADSLILGTMASGTIIVYQVGRMGRSALKRAKEQLQNVKVNVIGIILNDITSTEMEPHYGYYYSSYKYYAAEPQEPPENK